MRLEKIILGLSLALYGCAPAIAPIIDVPVPEKTKNTLYTNPPVPMPEIEPAPVPNPSIEFIYADFIEFVKDPNYPEDVKGVIALDNNGNFIFKHRVLRQIYTVDEVNRDDVTELREFKEYANQPWNYVLLFERNGLLGNEPEKIKIGDTVIIVLGTGELKYFEIYDQIEGTVEELGNPYSPIKFNDMGTLTPEGVARYIYLDEITNKQGEYLVVQVCGENSVYRYFTIGKKIQSIDDITQQN